jgi:hypothetical protein
MKPLKFAKIKWFDRSSFKRSAIVTAILFAIASPLRSPESNELLLI